MKQKESIAEEVDCLHINFYDSITRGIFRKHELVACKISRTFTVELRTYFVYGDILHFFIFEMSRVETRPNIGRSLQSSSIFLFL